MKRTVTAILRSPIFRRVLAGFVVVAAILGVGLVATDAQFETLNRRFDDLLERDLALVDGIETLQREFIVLQGAKRGYLLTGDLDFLARYEQARAVIIPLIRRVERESAERALVSRFEAAFQRYTSGSSSEIALRQRADRGELPVAEVIGSLASHTGPQIADDGERALKALHDAELLSVREQRDRVNEASVRSRRLAAASMVLALLVAVLYGARVSRDIGGALGELQQSIEAIGRREPVGPLSSRDDELGQVSESFRGMATQLNGYETELRERVRAQEETLHELRDANEALGRAMRVKSDFLATMSHELRTPLNAVIGLADLLLGSSAERLSPRARQALETMRGSGSHLLAMLDDILDLAKIDAGKMTYRSQDFDLGPVVRACVATVLPLLGDKAVDVDCDVVDAVRVRADTQRVRQVLLNLLSNAVKFTLEGSVRVRVEREGGEAIVRITDTGVGIAHEEVSHLFEDFHQVRSGDARPFGGTGLGLALSRRMARAMDGDVTVASEPGRGSTFSLRLSLSRDVSHQENPHAHG